MTALGVMLIAPDAGSRDTHQLLLHVVDAGDRKGSDKRTARRGGQERPEGNNRSICQWQPVAVG